MTKTYKIKGKEIQSLNDNDFLARKDCPMIGGKGEPKSIGGIGNKKILNCGCLVGEGGGNACDRCKEPTTDEILSLFKDTLLKEVRKITNNEGDIEYVDLIEVIKNL